MKMERVETSIPIVYCDLDMTHMGEGEGICLSTIYLREERVIAHG